MSWLGMISCWQCTSLMPLTVLVNVWGAQAVMACQTHLDYLRTRFFKYKNTPRCPRNWI